MEAATRELIGEEPQEGDATGFATPEREDATAEESMAALFSGKMTLPAASVTAVAPPFAPVHRSWEDFDTALKAYAQATYQLYVVRTTTSVKRRNLRIADLSIGATGVGAPNDGEDDNDEESKQDSGAAGKHNGERVLIPAHWQWYSKTMMCTHGWKDRHRGTGKRAMTMVRSTGCPVKMCITLQHNSDASGEEGWQVVVTKHVRTHNHPLSKELYLFYIENRRIYDPELLAVVGGSSPRSGASAEVFEAYGDDSDSTLAHGELVHDEGTSSIRNGGSVPQMNPKVFGSWGDFHKALQDYTLSTRQHFRIRSTISAQSKNSKLVDQAAKAGKSVEEISAQLVPENQKWYSKLLICNHGWKRKSRSKIAQFQRRGGVHDQWNDTSNACPAMLMARVQRDIHDKWRVVINRQLLVHNHDLNVVELVIPEPDDATEDGTENDLAEHDAADALLSSSLEQHIHHEADDVVQDEEHQHVMFVNATVEQLSDLQSLPRDTRDEVQGSQNKDQHDHTSIQDPSMFRHENSAQSDHLQLPEIAERPVNVVTEVVVRVPKLSTIHESWDAFHDCLQRYSESTYQSYRTRTTSSVKGRNQKILEMRSAASCGTEGSVSSGESTRLIPEQYKWYSKTLTCTHGWKERRRGSGKRTIHIVRSTLCPVKICATLQYLEPAGSTEPALTGWRVVVTKHIVNHNHNLSKELYQHYCDNRRIYDPELLAIDHSSATRSIPIDSTPRTSAATSENSTSATTIADDQHSFLSSTMTGAFDQTEAFETQQALSDSAYIGNSASLHQAISSGESLPLMSYTPMMTAGPVILHQHATANALESMAAHQLFGHGAVFGNSTYTSIQSNNSGNAHTSGAGPTSNILCQLHGSGTTSVDSSTVDSSECTCLRVPITHQYLSTTGAGVDTVEQGTRRRMRDDTGIINAVAQASKRMRGDEGANDRVQPPDDQQRSLPLDSATAVSSIETHEGTTLVSQFWSPENPIQAMKLVESDGLVMWRVPRLKRRHESWTDFSEYLNAYSESTYQLYRVRTTSSINARNTRISQQLQQLIENGGGDNDQGTDDESGHNPYPQLVPSSYEWYSKTYVCTHGWKERRRGKGQRVSHNLRSTSCPVKLCVTLQRDPHDANNWNVVVTKHLLDHNHEISASMYQSYSENRRIKDPELLSRAEQMWRDGQPRRKIFEFLKEASHVNILMKDVHNLVQKWQQQHPQENAQNDLPAFETTQETNISSDDQVIAQHPRDSDGSSVVDHDMMSLSV